MLAAAEASMGQAASDDTERERMRAALYSPPGGQRRRGAGRSSPSPGQAGMTAGQAQALMARMAAEDVKPAAR